MKKTNFDHYGIPLALLSFIIVNIIIYCILSVQDLIKFTKLFVIEFKTNKFKHYFGKNLFLQFDETEALNAYKYIQEKWTVYYGITN